MTIDFKYFRSLEGYVRKPTAWNDVGTPVSAEKLNGLKCYHSEALGIDRQILKKFDMMPEDMVFLVVHNGGLYLVNTEGCEYARYVRYVGSADEKFVDKADLDSFELSVDCAQ